MQPIKFKLLGYRTELQSGFLFLALFYLLSGVNNGNPLWYAGLHQGGVHFDSCS